MRNPFAWYREKKEDDWIAKKYLDEALETYRQLLESDMRVVAGIAPPDPELHKEVLSLKRSVKDALLMNSTVASCTGFIADSFSSIPYVLKKVNRKTGIVETVPYHPLVKRLNKPNSWQDGITHEKVKVQHMLLVGHALVAINRTEGALAEARSAVNKAVKKDTDPIDSLELLDPDDFDFRTDGKQITKFELKPAVKDEFPDKYMKSTYAGEEVMKFIDTPNPTTPYVGMGRVQSAWRSIDISSKIQSWWIESLRNGCRKDVLMKFKRDLGENQFRRIKSQVERQLSSLMNGRGAMVVGRDPEVTFLNQSPAELDFSNTEKDAERSIMSMFRVPAPLLNEAEHSTYNNQKEARQAFWLDNILMLCGLNVRVLNLYLLPIYGLDKDSEFEWFITYDFSKVDALIRQYLDLIKGAIDLFAMGHSRDDINLLLDLGWKPGPGSSDSYISANVTSFKERELNLQIQQKALAEPTPQPGQDSKQNPPKSKPRE